MTAGNHRHVEEGQGSATGETTTRGPGVLRRRSAASIALLMLAAIMLPTVEATASKSASPLEYARVSSGNAQARVELAAGRKGKEEGDARVAPPRGSSAQLQGGSSADRYGGTSADRGGVAGARDVRNRGVHQRPFNTGTDSGGGKGKKHSEQNGDDERNQDNEEE